MSPYQILLSQNYRLKRKFEANKKLKEINDGFMNKYVKLKYMEVVLKKDIDKKECYNVPYPAVFRNHKLRVVFDESFADFKGKIMNDLFMMGPKLQTHSIHIIIIWKFYKSVITVRR